MKKMKIGTILAMAGLVVSGTQAASWNGGDGDWSTVKGAGTTGWTLNEPVATTDAWIGNTLSDGATVTVNANNETARDLYLGQTASTSGHVVINNGGVLSTTRNIGIGQAASTTGTLTINTGGTFANTSGGVLLGWSGSSTGTMTVNGGTYNNTLSAGYTTVGHLGSGTLNVSNGGTVDSVPYINWAGLGATAGAGSTTVTGAGSTLHSDSYLMMGNYGVGTMSVLDGGVVSSDTYMTVGQYAAAAGSSVLVSGDGSTLELSSALNVGNLGAATLTISDDGLVVLGDASVTTALKVGLGAGASSSTLTINETGMLAIYGTATDWSGFLVLINSTVGNDRIGFENGSGWTAFSAGTLDSDYTITAGTGDLAGYSVLETIPEPATLSLLGFAGIGALWLRRFRM